ncbi:MAG: 4-hydroxy-tetrahydrodipicolinate reductase [Bacteroidota bacterium]
MNIALLGYGKMGKIIEETALSRGHQICFKTSKEFTDADLSQADVAIDFSIPEAAFTNIKKCLENGIPVISGTTGWLEKYEEAVSICNHKNGKFIYASNFSLGVNLFFNLNEKLAKMMAGFNQYKAAVHEIHHTEKKDAPSGTAISLAEQIVEQNKDYHKWNYPSEAAQNNELPISAERIEDVKGTHTISYRSEIDDIEIKHTAHTRKGFALGAVIAAEWLQQKSSSGVYTMKDVLADFNNI